MAHLLLPFTRRPESSESFLGEQFSSPVASLNHAARVGVCYSTCCCCCCCCCGCGCVRLEDSLSAGTTVQRQNVGTHETAQRAQRTIIHAHTFLVRFGLDSTAKQLEKASSFVRLATISGQFDSSRANFERRTTTEKERESRLRDLLVGAEQTGVESQWRPKWRQLRFLLLPPS